MGKFADSEFFFVLDDKDTKKKWHTHDRTTYGAFALEPKSNKKRGQFFIESSDGSSKTKAQSITRILGDSLVVTYTAEGGFGLGYIAEGSDAKARHARKERKRKQRRAKREVALKSGRGGYNAKHVEDKENMVRNTQQGCARPLSVTA